MTPSTGIRAAAAAVATALIGGIVTGAIYATGDTFDSSGPPADCSRTYAEWGDATGATHCLYATVYGPSQSFGALCIQDDGSGYAMARICVVPDADASSVPAPPEGFAAIEDSEWVEEYTPGLPAFSVWTAADPDAPFRGACSSGSDCAVNGEPAPLGVTLAPGTWSGSGCVPKTHVESFGRPSWPAACPSESP